MNSLVQLYSDEQIKEKVRALALKIDNDYRGSNLSIVYATNGASVFCSDLIRFLTIPVSLNPISFINYSNQSTSGEVRLLNDVSESLFEKHVLLMDGMIISGKTPNYLYKVLKQREPLSLEFCALGIKPTFYKGQHPIKYYAFEFSNEMVIGYGIGDGAEKQLKSLHTKNQ
jgi:hypoxanthine phosphoribosyltransferase